MSGSEFASIIIPVHNQLRLTRLCLEAIKASTPQGSYEIVVIDNGSDDGTSEYLKTTEAHVIRFDANRGISVAWNRGLREAAGKFYVFLHNDVLVSPGWLPALLKPFSADRKVGCSCPSSTEMDLGPAFGELASSAARLEEKWWESQLASSCFAVSANTIHRVGDFDEALTFGPYADYDFTFRLVQKRLKTVRVNNALVHHFLAQTALAVEGFTSETDRRDWEYMRSKWRLPASMEAKADDPDYRAKMAVAARVEIPERIPDFRTGGGPAAERAGVGRLIACVSCFNDDNLLPGCIETLGGFDEIVLVDGAYAGYPHTVPWSTDGTLEWIRELQGRDQRIRLIECEKAWKDEIEKRSAYFVGETGDWYFQIDADERLVSSEETPVENLKRYLETYPFDSLLVDVETRPSTVSLERYARIFRHLPGMRYEMTHFFVVADEKRVFLDALVRGTISLYSGLHLLHLKIDRGKERLEDSNDYYRALRVEEAEAIKREIIACWDDPSRALEHAALVDLFEDRLKLFGDSAVEDIAIDPKYLTRATH
ncbi:MAG: glycosyltransferase family 2 protein [Candidatus Aquicultorales bacterium]